ncbi:N utilization substance protein A [Bacilli bacterium PM5-3]|nr:N utilization substance protein A [Bacilli bacterium PM5-3]
MKAKDFINAVEILEKERGIPKDVVVESLKEALEKAYKKNYDTDANVEVIIDPDKGDIQLVEKRVVVDNLDDEETEIFIDEAKEINENYEIGDIVETTVDVEEFGRLAAIHAKQVVRQKIREVEKTMVYDEFVHKKDDIITGVIDRVESNFAIIDLGKTGGILPITNQIPNERLYAGSKIKVYVVDVDKSAKGAQVVVSRSDSGFLKRLFEAEVPDVYDGTVVIKSIAREAGDRSKIAVYSTKEGVDPIGSCIGPKGTRVQAVSEEVCNEKIDIVEYSEDPVVFITNTLAPSKVISVNFDEENKSAIVVVDDDQLSLAIGKKGQNVRLAVRLTGFKIDIKSLSDATEQGIEILNNGNVNNDVDEEVVKPAVNKKPKKQKANVELPTVTLDEFEEVDEVEDKPVVDIETLLQDIREATPNKKVKIKKEKTEKKESKEDEITFLDVEKPKEEPVVPIYTEEELAEIRAEEEKQKEFENEFYDDVDYDEYDKYYD